MAVLKEGSRTRPGGLWGVWLLLGLAVLAMGLLALPAVIPLEQRIDNERHV